MCQPPSRLFANNVLYHYYKDAFAYTEDHVLIHKVYCYNIFLHSHSQDLMEHLERYGRVLELELSDEYTLGRCCTTSALVHFERAQDAANVLRRGMHMINGSEVFVQGADSWLQPTANRDYEENESTGHEPSSTGGMHLLDLDDYCLERIMRQLLPTDQLRLVRTHRRFRNLFEQLAGIQFKVFVVDVVAFLSVWEMRDFFQLAGGAIRRIEGIIPPGHCQRLCRFLGKHCVKLDTLRLMNSKLMSYNLCRLLAGTHQLRELRLHNCSLCNVSLPAISHLIQLRLLDLSNNPKLTGSHMCQLPKCLETLILNGCTGLLGEYLVPVCERQTQLKDLQLVGIDAITDDAMLQAVHACRRLRVLHLENCPRVSKSLLYGIHELCSQPWNQERALPLQVHVFGTAIGALDLEDERLANRELVCGSLLPPPPPPPEACEFPANEEELNLYNEMEDLLPRSKGPNYPNTHVLDMGFMADSMEVDENDLYAEFAEHNLYYIF